MKNRTLNDAKIVAYAVACIYNNTAYIYRKGYSYEITPVNDICWLWAVLPSGEEIARCGASRKGLTLNPQGYKEG